MNNAPVMKYFLFKLYDVLFMILLKQWVSKKSKRPVC